MDSLATKKLNRLSVLYEIITAEEPLSRIELAQKLKLSKMTLSNIVNEFISNGYLCEVGICRKVQPGPNPIRLDLASRAPKVIGLSLQRSQIAVVVTDLKLRVCFEKSIPTQPSYTVAEIEKILDDLLESALRSLNGEKILGIGITAPGPIDAARNLILEPGNFYGIKNYNVVEYLRKKTGLPLVLAKDIVGATLTEKLFGTGRRLQNFVLLSVDHGIGIGIVENGNLYQKSSSLSGELGHCVIDFNGPKCYCGKNGCLEAFVDFDKLIREINACAHTNLSSISELCAFAEANPNADAKLKEMLKYLSIGLANCCDILNTSEIILSSGIVGLGPLYKEFLEKTTADFMFRKVGLKILYSRIRNNIYLLGSAGTVIAQFLELF